MRKWILSVVAVFAFVRMVHAVCPTPNNFCVGAPGDEMTLDSSGNLTPSATGVGSLGTSSLAWKDTRTGTLTATGAVTQAGNVTMTGASAILSLTGATQPSVQIATAPTTTTASLYVGAPTASSTGTLVSLAASQTANAIDVRTSGNTSIFSVGPNGHVLFRSYTKTAIDTLVPDGSLALIIDTNGTLANQVCIATGTAAGQWRALQGPSTLGCGTGN